MIWGCAPRKSDYVRPVKRFRSLLWLAVLATGAIVLGCRMNRPPTLGLAAGKLLPCPGSPNCVCSQDPDADHQIAPLAYTGDGPAALGRLKSVVMAQPRARITEEHGGYLRAEFTSLIFRFVDDVEFVLDENAHVIHVRSASRVGHSDLGVNRRRVERLRTAFAG